MSSARPLATLVALLGLVLAAGTLPGQAQDSASPGASAAPAAAFTEYPGAEMHAYRTGAPQPMPLYVVKPKGWQATDKRTAWVHFYGGGWARGTAESGLGWARAAANRGMVGIAPDYRVKERFGTSPLEAVADARAAMRWVQEHAAELGVDPARIVVSGNSAGGHLALWTAIISTPPGSDPDEAPLRQPAAIILSSAVTDTSLETGYGGDRFGGKSRELSPAQVIRGSMPPILMLHGDADKTVPYESAVRFDALMKGLGNSCQFITVPGGSHNFRGDLPEWKDKTTEVMAGFLKEQGLAP